MLSESCCHGQQECNRKSHCLWEDIYSGFIFCCLAKLAFPCPPCSDRPPVEEQIQPQLAGKGFHDIPWATREPLATQASQSLAGRPSGSSLFPLQSRTALGSEQRIFYLDQRGVLAVRTLRGRSQCIYIGTDVCKINFLLTVECSLKCHRGNDVCVTPHL